MQQISYDHEFSAHIRLEMISIQVRIKNLTVLALINPIILVKYFEQIWFYIYNRKSLIDIG